MVGGDRWCAFKSRSQTVFYSDLLSISHILCPAVPFKTAQGLESFLSNISSTRCFPIRRALLRTGSTFPALQRECQLRSSAFPNQTDNLSLRCFSRKSKNYSFSRLVPCLHCYMVGGHRWCAFKSGEATQGERGAEANSLTFHPTQQSFGSQADCSICSSFTPRPIRQVKLHLQRMPKNNSSCCC